MNLKTFFILTLIIVGVIIFGITAKSKQKISTTASSKIETGSQVNSLLSQTKTMGVVEVEVIPISVEQGKNIIIKLVMNNHSVNLNYDYTKIITLTDDQGNTYKPSEWSGGTGGHHIKGELTFPSLSQQSKELTLTINGVDNKTESFSWKL